MFEHVTKRVLKGLSTRGTLATGVARTDRGPVKVEAIGDLHRWYGNPMTGKLSGHDEQLAWNQAFALALRRNAYSLYDLQGPRPGESWGSTKDGSFLSIE